MAIERAERDKDICEQQLNNTLRNLQSLVKETGSLASKSVQIYIYKQVSVSVSSTQ